MQDPHSRRLIGTIHRQYWIYVLDEPRVLGSATLTSTSITDLLTFFHFNSLPSSFYLLHSHLGHAFVYRLKYLSSTRTLGKLQISDISNCCGCKLTEFSTLSF